MKEYFKDYIKPVPEGVRPLISVCVAVYNSASYLPRCFDSIREQTYDNLEVILVDDGSTDESGEVCDRYAAMDDRFKVIHKQNGGLYTTRNTGIDAAKGEYICFLDGDDYIERDMYEQMLAALLTADADICVCRYRLVFEDGTKSDKSTGNVYVFEDREMLRQYLLEDEKILIQNCAWNKLYKRSLTDGLRFPDRWYEDMLYTPQLLMKVDKGVYIDKAYHNYICDRSSSIMNMGVGTKTFSDLIPNLYDRSAYLEAAGFNELARISDHHLYKKLLDLVNVLNAGNDPNKKEYLAKLDSMIKEGADRIDMIDRSGIAPQNDVKKMKLYLTSPYLYRLAINFNEKIRLPAKKRIMK